MRISKTYSQSFYFSSTEYILSRDSDFIVNDVYEVAEELRTLSNFASKKVVIHNEAVFNREEGQLLKQ